MTVSATIVACHDDDLHAVAGTRILSTGERSKTARRAPRRRARGPAPRVADPARRVRGTERRRAVDAGGLQQGRGGEPRASRPAFLRAASSRRRPLASSSVRAATTASQGCRLQRIFSRRSVAARRARRAACPATARAPREGRAPSRGRQSRPQATQQQPGRLRRRPGTDWPDSTSANALPGRGERVRWGAPVRPARRSRMGISKRPLSLG